MNTSRGQFGAVGTQTAALMFGGITSPNPTAARSIVHSEEYNGTSYSEGNNLPVGKEGMGSAGIQTAALGFGGYIHSPASNVATTEEYDGTSWAAVPGATLTTARSGAASGNQGSTDTSAFIVGGGNTVASMETFEYNPIVKTITDS